MELFINSNLKSYNIFCFLLLLMVPQQETKFVGMEQNKM